jgi:putative aldouronate transport system permease protein
MRTAQEARMGERHVDVIFKVILFFWGLVTFYPIYYVFISSVSEGTAVDIGKVVLAPIGFNLESYRKVLTEKQFWISLGNTLFYTIVGTLYSLMISATAAYVLSKSYFRYRKLLNLALSFTLWFQAGFIPLYLNYRSLGVINSRWGIIVSFGVQAFNIILLRNYFESVPKELEEAGRIDGANEFRLFTDVYLPLSLPAMTTVGIYYAISRWNGFFWSMVLLKTADLIPLQVYLQQMIIQEQIVLENTTVVVNQVFTFTTLKYALIVCSILPVVAAYPFIQRYFSRGIMVGGVKE